ncbi:MAG: hypothetical protein JST54_35680 [Deltaproteobacteria bacterium]|nr:hypothetical protein [Deltaproteobacteria bacterium]
MKTFTDSETGKVSTEAELEATIRHVLDAWIHKRTDAEGFLDGMRPGVQCSLVWRDTELLSPERQRELYKEFVPRLREDAHTQALFASRLFRMGELEWLEVARRRLHAASLLEYRDSAQWIMAFHEALGAEACVDFVRRAIDASSAPDQSSELVLDTLLALGPSTPLWRSILEQADAYRARRLFVGESRRIFLPLFLQRLDRLRCDFCRKKKEPFPTEVLTGPVGSICRDCLRRRRVRADSRCVVCGAATAEASVPLCAPCEADVKASDERFAALKARRGL